MIATTAKKQLTISGQWQQSRDASGGGFCTSCMYRSEQWLSLVAQWGDSNQKERWQCLQGWFVIGNNGSDEFGLLHHLSISQRGF